MKTLALAAALLLAAGRGAAQSTPGAFVAISPDVPDTYDLAPDAPGGIVPGTAVRPENLLDGATREITYRGSVHVGLAGVDADSRMELRSSGGEPVTVRVRCFWADPRDASSVSAWIEFPCQDAGERAPTASPGTDRTVLLRAVASAPASATALLSAGVYRGAAYFVAGVL